MDNIRPLRTEDDYDWALAEIARYFDDQPAAGSAEGDRFEVLATLIEAYEDRHYPISAPDPVSAIRAHMEMAGLKQSALAGVLGSAPRASEILSRPPRADHGHGGQAPRCLAYPRRRADQALPSGGGRERARFGGRHPHRAAQDGLTYAAAADGGGSPASSSSSGRPRGQNHRRPHHRRKFLLAFSIPCPISTPCAPILSPSAKTRVRLPQFLPWEHRSRR
jgi:HTH-type transcriptional regulator/antitoxin HigA